LLVLLQLSDSLDNLNAVETNFDSEICLKVRLSDVVDNLAIDTYLFKLCAILGQLDLFAEPLSNISGVPLVVVTFEF
jgi:hypothetical protein